MANTNNIQLKKINKSDINTFLFVLLYIAVFYLVQLFLFRLGIYTLLPDSASLNHWDAGIYKQVADFGYIYNGDNETNTGVYVLLPWVWRLLHVGYLGMVVTNAVFFSAGFTIITRIYPITTNEKFLWLTTPSLYFMWVPYTEALFCLLMAIAFYGIKMNNRWLTYAGLFLVSMSRATAVFLIPSLLIMELLTNDRNNTVKAFLTCLARYILPVLAGTFAFVLVQFHETGQWFPYFKIQVSNLGHKFSMPSLPFCNVYGGDRITWLSALAMFPCVIALIILVLKSYNWLFKNRIFQDKVWILTLSYLPVILFTMVFFNPKWGLNRTNLFGIHRYVFCSPFIFVFFYSLMSKVEEYRLRHFIFVFVICNLLWFTMGSYWDLKYFLFYNFNTLIVVGYMLYANKKMQWVVLALCALNLFFQISLFQQYISGLFTD